MTQHYSLSSRRRRPVRDVDTEWANGHGLPLVLVACVVGVMALMMPDDLPFAEVVETIPVDPIVMQVDPLPTSGG